MALAMHEGKIHLTLRNPEDTDTTKVASLDTKELLGNGNTVASGPRRATSKAPTVVYRDRDVPVAAAPPPAPYKVTVIKKSQSTTTGTAQDAGK